jgi:hypothetical protein
LTVKKSVIALTTAVLVLSGFASDAFANPAEGAIQNPPPADALKSFGKYELKEVAMGPPYAGQKANDKAIAKIREHMQTQIAPVISAWNIAGAQSGKDTTLLIEPAVSEIKFIGGGARFWAGALAGSSYVVIKVKLTEQPSGRVIGEPEFFQRANAWSGAYTVGAQDNDMLRRIASIIGGYLGANYETAAGGPTGRVDK